MTGYEQVIDLLDGDMKDGRYACPVHGGHALKVDEGDNGVPLVCCFAGCDSKEIVKALGLDPRDLWGTKGRVESAHYVYQDADGSPLLRVTRWSPKGFTQQRWLVEDGQWVDGLQDTPRVPFLLPQLHASSDSTPVYLVEGEKDAINVTMQGYLATTLLGGSGKWRPEYEHNFAYRHVILVGDNDDAGRTGVAKLRTALKPIASRLEVLYPPAPYKDVTDLLLAGGTLDDLVPEVLDVEALGPFDWQSYTRTATEWLFKPYVPRGARVLAFGTAGSLKSLWALWLASKLSQEGRRVAYFNLEMRPSDLARRLKQSSPNPKYLTVYTKLHFGNAFQIDLMKNALVDHDLIVIDSWSAAQTGVSNDEVAILDREVLQPLIDDTGATVMILDNTGHAIVTDRGKVKPDHARGASAKGDKMEVTLHFERPFESDNYRTQITMRKMRLDESMASPVDIYTPRDRVEFYRSDDNAPLWGEDDVVAAPDPVQPSPVALAREKDRLGRLEAPSEVQ